MDERLPLRWDARSHRAGFSLSVDAKKASGVIFSGWASGVSDGDEVVFPADNVGAHVFQIAELEHYTDGGVRGFAVYLAPVDD